MILKLLIFIMVSVMTFAGCHNLQSEVSTNEGTLENKNVISEKIYDEIEWKWIIEPGTYEDLCFVDDNLVIVTKDNNKYSIYNLDDHVLFSCEYDQIEIGRAHV